MNAKLLFGAAILAMAVPARAESPLPAGELPPGFEETERVRPGLIAAGGATAGVAWSLVSIIGFNLERDAEPGNDDKAWPLFVPVAGPFIAMGLYDEGNPPLAYALFFTNGLTQLGGLAMVIVGVTATETWLVPTADGIAVGGSF